jgi:hypothetical protein
MFKDNYRIMDQKMTTEYINTLKQMVNEFDLVFDYIDKNTVKKLKDYLEEMNAADVLEKEMDQYVEDMKQYEKSLYKITTSGKIKSKDLEFLNSLKLFRGLLVFSVFKDENKNTKRTLAVYLKTMYMAASVAKNKLENLDVYLETIEEEQKQVDRPKSKQLDQVFGSLLQNNALMSMATELTKDLQQSNVDPMLIMTSLLGGTPNAEVNKLVGSITSKLEQKINSGEINKQELETQAKSMMSAIQSSDMGGQMGDLTKMFGKMK